MTKKYWFIFCVTMMLTACSGNNQGSVNELPGRLTNRSVVIDFNQPEDERRTITRSNGYSRPAMEKDWQTPDDVAKERSQREAVIKSDLMRLAFIEDASVSVLHHRAVVGIVITGGIYDDKIDQMEKEVEQKVKNADAMIDEVAVTIIPEMNEALNDALTGEQAGGAPQSAPNNRITDLFDRPVPVP